MNQQEKKILEDDIFTEEGMYSLGWYLYWAKGNKEAVLDGDFTADELMAIAHFMKTGERT